MKIFNAGKSLFRRGGAKPLAPGRNKRISGNIFFALFAAVGMVGAVGYGFNTVIKGPIRGMTEVTKRTVAESTVITSSKLAIVGATTQQTLGGDCDADGSIEPIPYRNPGTGVRPVGGGYLPTDMLPSTLDPWNTEYGYCAWDAGSLSVSNAVVACGGATPRRLQGSPGGTQASIAIISAGRDKIFQTSCIAYNGASPNNPLVVKVAGSDDVVLSYTYAEANDLGNGLWKPSIEPLKTATTTTSGKGLEVSGGGTFTDKVVLTGGGLVLPDQTSTGPCDSLANDKQIRRNTSSSPPSIEICDFTGGLGWTAVSGTTGDGSTGSLSGQLVGHWQLNETTGTIAKDRLARADGTLVDGPIWEPNDGKIGGSLLFDASIATQSVRIPRQAFLEPSAITIAAWLKPGTTQPLATTRVIAKQHNGAGNAYSLSINNTPRWVLGIRYSGGTRIVTSATGSYQPNVWQHVVGVYDPNGPAPQGRIYINGVLSQSQNFTDAIDYTGFVGGDLYFGNSGTGNARYNGSLDDVRIYNYGMTDLQVEELYQLALPAINVQTVKKPGKMVTWGNDVDGELGNGSVEGDRSIPGPGISGDFIDVSVRGDGGCGIKKDRTIWCWGDNSTGQLGNGTNTPSSVAEKVLNIDDAVQVSRAPNYGCALRESGSIWCWGGNSTGHFGNGTTTASYTPVKGPDYEDFVYVSVGFATACGIRVSGEAWCWGRGDAGALGNGATSNSNVPVKVSNISNFSSLNVLNYEGVCGVTKDGKGWCWGTEGAYPRFGNGATSGVQTVPSQILNITDFIEIRLLSGYGCGVRANGKIACWGSGSNGVLGQGNLTTSDIPLDVVNIDDFVKIGAASASVCGIRKNGEAWCWGDDTAGQLGAGTIGVNSYVPKKVIGENFLQIDGSAGENFYAGLVDTTPHKTAPLDIAKGKISYARFVGCAIQNDESLWCWGRDRDGQIGNGPGITADQHYPYPVDVGGSALGWSKVSVGTGAEADPAHVCGIKTDGTGWCWGANANGQLGNGGTATAESPVQMTDTGPWSDIKVNNGYSCGLKSEGTLWCWGADTNGRLGNGAGGSTGTPTEVFGGGTWKEFSLGGLYACGIKSDATLWCWGTDSFGVLGNGPTIIIEQQAPFQVGIDKDWKSLELGGSAACAIKNNGSAWCWGGNGNGKLGNGNTTNQDSPDLVRDPGPWISISTTIADGSTCGIKMDGSAWCWGTDSNGVLGNGTTITADQYLPYPVDGGGTWKALEVNGRGACGIKSDDSVWCWGQEDTGSLGNGPTIISARHSPYPVSFIPPKAKFIDGESGAGSLAQGSMATGTTGIAETSAATRALTFPGSGRSILRDTSAPAHLLIDATESGSSAQMALGIPAYNYTFGYNSQTGTFGFAPGSGWIENLYPALEVSNTGDVGIGTSGAPSAKLDVAGGIKLPADASCTGSKGGTLAYNSGKIQYCDSTWKDLAHTPSTIPWDLGKATLTVGNHGCSLKPDGTAWCWGNGANGKLGNGGTSHSSVPVQVSDVGPWISVDSSTNHSCGIKANGTAWCWGTGANGRLGNGGTADSSVPVQVVATGTWIDIEAGSTSTCGIKSDGTAWCWGVGSLGKLGNGSTADSSTPVQVSGGGTWIDISSGASHNCGIKNDGTAWCWGGGSNGKLGNGGGADSSVPVPVTVSGVTTWVAITTPSGFSCGIKSDGTAWCWGIGNLGHLGNGANSSSNVPVAVSGGGRWIKIANTGDGTDSMCGIKSEGDLWCWGTGAGGRLGNGGTSNQNIPIVISLQGPWVSVAGGEASFCATRADATTWCWGHNGQGRLGNGLSGIDSYIPVKVID